MDFMLPGLGEIQDAAKLIYRSMPATPQYSWPLMNARAGAEVWVKHENHTPVGAFKVRGGLVYMDWLRRERPEIRTVVSATRGNHGQSIAFAAAQHGIRAVIVVPLGNSVEKNRAMRGLGAELVEFGEDFQAASDHAAQLAQERGWHRVPSYDRLLVTGVATYALEMLSACPVMDTVYVPIGLGSGVSGMIAVRNALGLTTKIVGVVSSLAPAYALSFAEGPAVEHEATTTIADGVACRKPDEAALEIVRAGVDRIVMVSDEEAKEAMRICFAATHNVAEGAGALGLVALLKDRAAGGARVGTVLSGGNVDSDVFARVLGGVA
ncbi:MAG: threonine dehydratase [Edaphobacter sp.]